ncbi:hypothetical protein AK830_g7828 [Neonectria ditissima]|uniref:Transcription factor domain-containing protein n=1 Tax=Neonectria ditissima TaxID=78410 RepID=A0A0P7AW15_9HYPO|nr:hypothetical protein AK830_g7828 [Neonectria ditissima]
MRVLRPRLYQGGASETPPEITDVLFRHLQTHTPDDNGGRPPETASEGGMIAVAVGDALSNNQGLAASVSDAAQNLSAFEPLPPAVSSPILTDFLQLPSQLDSDTHKRMHSMESVHAAKPQPLPITPLDNQNVSPSDTFQPITSQTAIIPPPPFQHREDDQQEKAQDSVVIDMFSPELEYIPPADLQLRPDTMDWLDCMDFVNPGFPIAMPGSESDSPRSAPLLVSEDKMQRIRRLWSRQRPKLAARLISQLWEQVIHHKADNIFATSRIPSCHFTHRVSHSQQASSWSMDEECRARLEYYCKELDEFCGCQESSDEAQFTPQSHFSESPNDSDSGILSPNLTFYAQDWAIFSGPKANQSLCQTISQGTNLMPFCLGEITSQALSNCTAPDLLTTLASTLMVVYLALGFRDEIDECQAYKLCAQMLSMADKQGLFDANQGDDPALQLRQGPSDSEGHWKAWARVELIFCLVWLDMAYARLMNIAGVIEIDKVELHLPCADALFDGSTSASFSHAIQRGAKLTMPRMNIRHFHETPAPLLNDTSAQTLLRALYLRVIAARARGSDENNQFLGSHPVHVSLAVESSAKHAIANVLLMPTIQESVLKSRNKMNALGWNYICITLTADINLLEIASGRDGLEAASTALMQVAEWSRSAGARRAVLHAGQVFDILDSSRIRESHLTRPDLVLFVSALVISQYVSTPGHSEDCIDASLFPLELLQNIDWAAVGSEGLVATMGASSSSASKGASDEVRNFIQHGGPVAFAGEVQNCGSLSARKIVRKFAHLSDDFGTWDGSGYSQLLKMMCDSSVDTEYGDN